VCPCDFCVSPILNLGIEQIWILPDIMAIRICSNAYWTDLAASFGRTMKTEWTLSELRDVFPAMPRTAPSVFRCLSPAFGQGRYLKEVGGKRRFAHVRVGAEPAKTFRLRLLHAWPSSVPSFAIQALDEALLRGIVEGSFSAFPEPIWGCSITCTAVTHVSGETTPVGISIAASLAVPSLLGNGRWVVDEPPAKEPA
jgi:hypothetical protein